jgi:hypothetical protein
VRKASRKKKQDIEIHAKDLVQTHVCESSISLRKIPNPHYRSMAASRYTPNATRYPSTKTQCLRNAGKRWTLSIELNKKVQEKRDERDLLEGPNPLVAARIEADMVISTCSAAQEHAVRVEGGGSKRGCPVAEEARIWLEASDFMPVKVKDLDDMGGCTTGRK